MSDQTGFKKNFVIKLCIVGAQGSPQIRRVRLSNITVDGDISYPALVDVAIQYTFPDASLKAECYTVLMTYYDVDNDCITIASTEELVDAIEQFATPESKTLCLRITTDVKEKEPQIAAPRAQPDSPKRDSKKRTATEEVPNIVESFVSILANAVDHLQTQVNEGHAAKETKKSAPASVQTSFKNKKAAVNRKARKHDADATKKQMDSLKESNEASTKAPSDGKKESGEASPEEGRAKESSKEESKEENRPFIHNRHTCDGCLCTPIVGDRYHSTNLPDYDLCAKCRGNYKGDEIQFEVVELDRDRPMQERWHRRRMNSINRPGPCRRPQRGWHGGRGRGIRGPHGGGRNCGDADLKEAIRRSLQDVTSNQDNSEPEAKATKPDDEGEASLHGKNDVTQDGNETVEDTKEKSANNSEEKGAEEKKLNLEETNPTDILGTDKGDAISELSLPSNATDETEKVKTIDDAEDNKKAEEDEDEETDQANKDLTDDATDGEITITNAENDEGDTDAVVEQKTSSGHVSVNGEGDTESMVTATEANDQKASTGVIVADGDEDLEESTASEEDWQVVLGDKQDDKQDEMIARAAQLLGSALFESDLHSSENNTVSNMSLPSSIPSLASVADSNISPVVLDKWAVHLNQLHELGFYADKKSVEILERLTAANIGVDSEDEVSVTQVVNELLKN